jgi:hypothetical protein
VVDAEDAGKRIQDRQLVIDLESHGSLLGRDRADLSGLRIAEVLIAKITFDDAAIEMGFTAHVTGRIAFIDEGRIIAEGPPLTRARRAAYFTRAPELRVRQFLQTYHDRNALLGGLPFSRNYGAISSRLGGT